MRSFGFRSSGVALLVLTELALTVAVLSHLAIIGARSADALDTGEPGIVPPILADVRPWDLPEESTRRTDLRRPVIAESSGPLDARGELWGGDTPTARHGGLAGEGRTLELHASLEL